jgi:hypothetical protein
LGGVAGLVRPSPILGKCRPGIPGGRGSSGCAGFGFPSAVRLGVLSCHRPHGAGLRSDHGQTVAMPVRRSGSGGCDHRKYTSKAQISARRGGADRVPCPSLRSWGRLRRKVRGVALEWAPGRFVGCAEAMGGAAIIRHRRGSLRVYIGGAACIAIHRGAIGGADVASCWLAIRGGVAMLDLRSEVKTWF